VAVPPIFILDQFKKNTIKNAANAIQILSFRIVQDSIGWIAIEKELNCPINSTIKSFKN
jgi:hypothetical protein